MPYPSHRAAFPFGKPAGRVAERQGLGRQQSNGLRSAIFPSEFSWQPTRSKFMAVFNAKRSVELWIFIDRFIDESHSFNLPNHKHTSSICEKICTHMQEYSRLQVRSPDLQACSSYSVCTHMPNPCHHKSVNL